MENRRILALHSRDCLGTPACRRPSRAHDFRQPFFTQQALRDFHASHGIITQAWSPLGGVTRYRPQDGSDIQNPLERPTIVQLASNHGKTPAQVVLALAHRARRFGDPKVPDPELINTELYPLKVEN